MKTGTELFSWIASSTLLLAIPKCPACLAAYVTLWTGMGLSFTSASYLRYGAVALCCATLAALVINRTLKMAWAKKAGEKSCHQRN